MPTRPTGRTVTLRDGARVRLRPIVPEDKAPLAASFERLSEQSRYRRFLTTKSKLSAAELAYLVDEVDHSDHEAIVALEPATGSILGIARYVRSKDDPQAAEVAVTVADDWQRRGLGRALLDRLTYRARREGVRRFSALVLGENRPALGLFAGFGEAHQHRDASEIELLIDLPPERGMGAQLGRALRAAGAGTLLPARTLAQRVAIGVGPSAQVPALSSGPIRTIVLGLDGGGTSGEALSVAIELAADLDAVLHVVSAFSGARGQAAADRAVGAAERMAAAAGVEVRTHTRRGDAADTLIAAARERRAGLIVVGERGTSRGKRFIAGSVSNRVSHHAPCSVLIVRAEAK
jgi:nucleotide-binding universal stress UspA family protein/GNAT superfamily N-acetyltransferase